MSSSTPASTNGPRFIDIGVNLTDPMFRGSYHGKQSHQDDLDIVLTRASKAGVIAQILTGGNLEESHEALSLASEQEGFYSTAGCHPTRTSEMEAYAEGAEAYLSKIRTLIEESKAGKGKIVAVGECGLDYDRLHFSPEDVQKKHFATQLDLAAQVKLPLFLHSRAAHRDFVDIVKPKIDSIHETLSSHASEGHKDDPQAKRVGVVHSFTGTVEEVQELLDLGLFIGINGCSLKTQENLEVLKHIPLSRLMLETGKSLSLLHYCTLNPLRKLLTDMQTLCVLSCRRTMVRPSLDPRLILAHPVLQTISSFLTRTIPAARSQEGKVEPRLDGQRPQRTLHDRPRRCYSCQRQVGSN